MKRGSRIITWLLMICVLLGCISYTNIGTGHISVLAAERSNIVTQDFNYTGGGQSFTAPATAVYTFKLYGAGGGGENPDWVKDQLISAYDTSTDGGYTRRGIPYVYHDKVTGNYGGKGGYTEVKLSLTAGQTIYIYVGGTGTGMLWESFADGYQAGGYNGGGSAVHSGCSGGGATHIATTDRGTLDNYAAYQSEVLAVAGGGGGADNITDDGTCSPVHSGNGGGADGTAGDVFNDEESRVYPGQGGIAGTTTGGYAFGKGENAAGVDDAGGGGGGWYGGYSGNISSYGRYNYNSAGGGGSGYVNTTSPYYSGTVSQQAGINWGNGKVTVSYELATTVTFDLQGGKVDGSTTNPVRTMRAGTSDNNTQDWMNTSRMAKTGYMFAGFYTGTNGTGTKVYDIYSGGVNCVKNTDYWDDSGNWKYSGSTLTLYAYWLSNQCTMTVNYRKWNPNTNAWDIYDTKTEKVDYGTTYSPVAGTAPTGYVFDSKTADYTVAADKTFNVNFKPKQTTVTYYRNYSSADTSTASQTFTYAKTGEALTDQSWSRTGYNILGWAVSRTATVADYSLTNPVSDEWKNTYYPSVSLYAVWQAQEYSITYDLAGGTASGNPASYTVETPTFTLNNPTRTYYRFDGWSGTGITGLSTSVTISKGSVGNRQYTAHWTDITPPMVMPSPASIQWCRNTNLTINWLDYGDGLADNTGRNYFYFMSADGTKTSNYAYTPDAASNVGADLNGTYYLYIHEIKDKEGNVSLLGGAKTGVYHKFGPYKFDNEDPTVSVTPKAADWCTEKSVTITVNDTGGSGLSASNAYQYYLSTSNTSPTGGTWTNYTSGTAFTIGTGLNGTYYLFVKKISDNAGNVSTGSSYHMYGPYKFDDTAPTVTVSPESADWCNSVNVTITVADAGGSGLSGSNSYQYYLSTSDSSLTGGSWTNYTSGSEFTIGTGLNGTYYLYVKRVSDNAGNVSTTKGTAVTIEGTTYHRFGPHKFDNMAPEGTVTYYENNEMLGLWDNAHEPYGLMRIGDATDNLSGIREIYLYLYDEANLDNNTTLFFTGTGRNYELKFKLYTALADNRNVTKIHMAVYGVDEAGNVGELPITNYSFGFDGNEDPVKDEDIGFKKDEDGDGYIRDDFRIEARIVNVNGHQNFVSGGKAILEIYTFGYVEAVSAEFPSIRSQMRAEYDTEVNLVKTDIEVKEYNSCNHVFYIPLYCAESVYTDNLAWGYKKGMTQKRPVYITVDGSILKTIKTILK